MADKPTHWMVRNKNVNRPSPAVLLKETAKSFTYHFATPLTDGAYYVATKTRVPKSAHPDMRFFTDELLAIDYLASLMIRESEAARQKMLLWEERLAELKQVRNECVAKAVQA